MGLLDSIGAGLPGGNLSKPIMIALGALLASKALGGGGLGDLLGGMPGGSQAAPGSTQGGFFGNAKPATPESYPAEPAANQGGLFGGLGGLLQHFQRNGLGSVANSWVSSGQNQPISPDQLHQALGPDIVDQLAQRSGVSRQELLAELSKVLPGVVDKMTPDGRIPPEAMPAR